jgi:hypothetical protein
MATKNVQREINENVASPRDRIGFYFADASSPHPGALCADGSLEGNPPEHSTVRFENATPVLDGESKPTGAYTYAVNPEHGFTQAQVNNLKVYLAAIRKRMLVINGYTVV